MTLQAIIFGVDGVLAETQEARREAYNQVFEEAGLDWRWGRTVYAELIRGAGGDDLIERFFASRLPGRWQTDDLALLTSVMKRRFRRVYRDRLESGSVTLRDGIVDFLDAAVRDGIRIAIAGWESTEDVMLLLRTNLGFQGADRFDVIAASSAAHHAIHAQVLEEMALPAQDCLAVESSPSAVRAAKATGIPTAITWGCYPQLQACGEALLTGGASASFSGQSCVLGSWVGHSPDQMLARARDLHAAQKRTATVPAGIPTAWSLSEMEHRNAGSRYLEN
jgi:beta-phosphoglucomutase-like phosphatase (HAD superfamily)